MRPAGRRCAVAHQPNSDLTGPAHTLARLWQDFGKTFRAIFFESNASAIERAPEAEKIMRAIWLGTLGALTAAMLVGAAAPHAWAAGISFNS